MANQSVSELPDGDIYALLTKALSGEDTGDIELDDIEYDDRGIDVTLTDLDGNTRKITLAIQ